MTPDTLKAVGEALFGKLWLSGLVRHLDVSERTVRHWLAGETPIPPGVSRDVIAIIDHHVEKLGRLRRDIAPR